MRGLPFRASVPEIESFFQGYQLMPDGIEIHTGPDGRSSGEVRLLFVFVEHDSGKVFV